MNEFMGDLLRLEDECKLRGYSKKTIKTYKQIVGYYLRKEVPVRQFLLSYSEKSRSTMRTAYFALKFYHEKILKQEFKQEIPLQRISKRFLMC